MAPQNVTIEAVSSTVSFILFIYLANYFHFLKKFCFPLIVFKFNYFMVLLILVKDFKFYLLTEQTVDAIYSELVTELTMSRVVHFMRKVYC